MTIREADHTGRDLDGLVELAYLFLHDSPYGALLGPTREHIERFIFQVMGQGRIFVADTGGHLAGMFAAVIVVHPLSRVSYAEEIAWFVRPGHRRGGIGPQLLEAGIRWATTRGVSMLKLVAPVGSSVGKTLERRGCRALETTFVLDLVNDAAPR